MIKNIKFIEQKEKILLQRGKLIHEDQQGKHIIGHKNYKEEEGKSITTLSMVKMEELLQKYAGTGQIARDNGERVDFKEIIGKRIEDKVEVEYAFQELNDIPGEYLYKPQLV